MMTSGHGWGVGGAQIITLTEATAVAKPLEWPQAKSTAASPRIASPP